ncbi:MAG: hypothetical protein ACYSWZ_16950 [Planctomycetota bacterium]|jgi:prepilin-type processing-associated H-X9-DG protein
MSENDNTYSQKPKSFRPLTVSLVFAFVALLIGGLVSDFVVCIPLAIIGLAFGIIGLYQSKKNNKKAANAKPSIYGIVINLFLILMAVTFFHSHKRIHEIAYRIVCAANLRGLGIAMHLYANDNNQNYPPVNKWCELLIESNDISEKALVCRSGEEARCHYAINLNIKPNSPNDVVLLFETKGGWNQFGGPEILTTENHKGEGCNILFNDGSVEFVKMEQLSELKWDIEEDQESNSGNFRRPDNDKEMKYWLENMVCYHRFTNEEIRAATGLTEKEIIAALKNFNIRPDNRPKRATDAPLLVLPYPGGRHPRIGFLDGAIEPQRETKFSVFTPWDANSYVVVDVPEAIWSNLGLTYLAHTHIDTIWTKKGIELPKLEWNRHPDGTLDIERKLPNGIAFGMQVKPTKKAVRMELWLKNGTDKKLVDLRVQNCVMTKMAVGFEQQINDNKVLTNPYVACRDSDGKRWIITAWTNCNNPWGNDKCPCFHSDPKFPDLEPGQMHRLHGWLSFYKGTNIKAEFERIESTGWRDK